MDLKNRRNLPDCLPFRNKTPGQFTLIQSKLSRPSKSDTTLLGRFASCAGSLSNQIAFEFSNPGENSHDHLASVRGGVSPRLGNRLEPATSLADGLHWFRANHVLIEPDDQASKPRWCRLH